MVHADTGSRPRVRGNNIGRADPNLVGPVLGPAAVSGSQASHLQRRNGVYHLRLRVPDGLRLRLGMVEVKRSLQTYSSERARLLAAICVPRLRKVFSMVDGSDFSREHLRGLVQGCFDGMRLQVEDGYLPTSSEPELEVAEQAALAREWIREKEGSLANRSFSKSLLDTAATLCAVHGRSFENLTEERRHDLLEGLARAEIEQQKLYIIRLRDRLATYVPADPLFRCEINCTAPKPRTLENQAQASGPNVDEAISAYLDHGRKKWTVKTHAGRARQLRYFLEHFGPKTPLLEISTAAVRSYRDAIKRLRSNHHRSGATSFLARQTDNESHRISSKTAALLFESVKAFFGWATEVQGYLAVNPAHNVRIAAPKKLKGAKPRRPFSEQELRSLFMQPLFTGCLSARRRFQAGSCIVRDEYFWIPILAYYTGARLGELVQLHLGDLHLSETTSYFEVTEENGGKAGSDNAKHVKSSAGVRNVPLHPDLAKLGFNEFVLTRRKNRKPSDRLFSRIPFGSDGQASTVFSKWFARFLDKANLTDPALVFHSFRHGAEDAFRNSLQPQYVIDRIIGHTDGSTSAGYGEGVSLETAADAVSAMKLNVRLPQLWCGA